MRDLFIKFRKSEDGASLVEYAVALIVVVIVGSAGVIVIGQNAGELTQAGCNVANDAVDKVVANAGAAAKTGVAAVDC